MGTDDIFQNENVAMHLTGGWGWWHFGNADWSRSSTGASRPLPSVGRKPPRCRVHRPLDDVQPDGSSGSGLDIPQLPGLAGRTEGLGWS